MNDPILLICICALLGLNLILLLILLLRRKPADHSTALLKEELRTARQETSREQSELRRELGEQLNNIHRISLGTVSKISENTMQNLELMRSTLDTRMERLQRETRASVEDIRRTVQEQLSETLTGGLDTSFRAVTLQLEQVSKSIGEVQGLAPDIQGLRNVLSGVKNRGTWGEVQLGSILADLFAPGQYEAQFAITGSSERVDYAIRLPGQGSSKVYLPIDSKFPMDRYTNFLSAEQQDNPALSDAAKAALLRAVRDQAKDIRRKYVSPPYTTDFAVLFVPSEGLYALLAAEDFAFTLQQEHKVLLAGPTTLAALLNSLQMGFRTLAVQQRTADIMRTLQAVKTSLTGFGAALDSSGKSMQAALNHLQRASAAARGIERKLRSLEALEEAEAKEALGEDFLEETL